MDDLGLAVAFCVVQVTLLAAVVSVCYLCSRRTHPGFRSFIASTGVFVVLALSILCLSPYPNWTGTLDLGGSRTVRMGVETEGGGVKGFIRPEGRAAAGLGSGPVKSVVPRPNLAIEKQVAEIKVASVNPQSGSVPNSASGMEVDPEVAPGEPFETTESQPASSYSWTEEGARLIQWTLSWAVGLRDWLVAQFQVLLRWGWLAGIALLVGVTFNLLRLAVGWWELRRFRRRSIRIDSPALEESLDIVRAALSVRLPVELRQTAEMTSPATIGWLRPVVILPVDWEEWSEEERLGVLAHELAHISRHDFITGLFSQLVLSLHFYNPLITWLVHRLHLEQELAADAAAVRVLGGHKPYLRMLAGMALKDHVAVLPGAARTFFPQPGMLMARVELLRGNKLEAGEGSFSWRAAVRGVLVCVGLVLAGLRPLAGSDASEPPEMRLTSTFVPETAAGWMVWSPEQVRGKHSLSTLLFDPANHWPDEVVNGLRQISLFWVDSDGSETGKVNSLLPDGVILNFHSSEIRDAAFEYLNNHPESDLRYRLLGGPAPQRAELFKAGAHDLLLCRDETVLNLSVASSKSQRSPAWTEAWERAATGAALIGLRPDAASRFQVAGASYTALLNDFLGRLSGWSGSAEFALVSLDLNQDLCQVQVIPKMGLSTRSLLATVESLQENWQSRLAQPVPPGGQRPENYDPVIGNTWCQRLVNHCPAEALADRLQVEPSLSAMLGIVLSLRDLPQEVVSFERHWASHHAAYLQQSLDLLRSALLAYRVDHGEFPPLALRQHPSAPPHSWRVALLPYVGRQDLYDRYRFDLPWNSPENLQLLSNIPDIYRGFGSLSNTSAIHHGAGLPSAAVSRVLNDWTEVDALLLFGSSAGSIPWTAPMDGVSARDLLRGPERQGPLGGLAELTTGDLEQRIWSTPGESMSE